MTRLNEKRPGILSRRGFTLIELLVSIGIFSVIALSLYSVFANSMLLNKKAKEIESFYRDVRWSIEALRHDLENVVPFSFKMEYEKVNQVNVREATSKNVTIQIKSESSSSGDSSSLSFVGEKNSCSFIISDASGLKRVSYYLRAPEEVSVYQTNVVDDAGSKGSILAYYAEKRPHAEYLVREEVPLFPSEEEGEEEQGDEEILSISILEESLSFSYAYYERYNATGELMWRDDWNEPFFPVGIKFEATFVDPENQDKVLEISKYFFIPLGGWGDLSG